MFFSNNPNLPLFFKYSQSNQQKTQSILINPLNHHHHPSKNNNKSNETTPFQRKKGLSKQTKLFSDPEILSKKIQKITIPSEEASCSELN